MFENCCAVSAVKLGNSEMSAPAAKFFRPPVTTTARVVSSTASSSQIA